MKKIDNFTHEWTFDLPWHMVDLKDWFYMVNVGYIEPIVFFHVRVLGMRSLWTWQMPMLDDWLELQHIRTKNFLVNKLKARYDYDESVLVAYVVRMFESITFNDCASKNIGDIHVGRSHSERS